MIQQVSNVHAAIRCALGLAACIAVALSGCAFDAGDDDAARDSTADQALEANATYTFRNTNSQKCLDVTNASRDDGANIQLWECTGQTAQQFTLVPFDSGYVSLRNVNSGKCLDVWARSTAAGANVAQYTCNGGANQQFRIEDVGAGAVRLIARHSGMALDAWNWGTANGTNVAQWNPTGGANQSFLPTRVGSSPPSPSTETPKLRVSGRFLQDPSGKNVLLHGWMQPTASWFNGEGNRYRDPTNWQDRASVDGMLNFLRDAATVMSDPSPKYGRSHGWYNTFVRVNTDSVGGWTSERGLVDRAQFDAWINNFLVPYANHLRSRGLYLVLCATGPMVVNVGGDGSRNMGQGTQQRMLTFWQTVANAPGIKSADNVMFELMNEPVAIETRFGANDWGFGSAPYWEALRNWMQPVVNTVRSTGADNVIWLPTLGWQGEPQGWARYPISGANIGIAAHLYPAYGGVHNDAAKLQNLWNSNYKPAADLKPMVLTEMMWIPNPPGGYDDLFNGTTAGFGTAAKRAIDNQGNVSYVVGFLADHLVDLRRTAPAGTTLSSQEGSQAYFSWLPTYVWAAPTGHRFLR